MVNKPNPHDDLPYIVVLYVSPLDTSIKRVCAVIIGRYSTLDQAKRAVNTEWEDEDWVTEWDSELGVICSGGVALGTPNMFYCVVDNRTRLAYLQENNERDWYISITEYVTDKD